MQNHYLYFKVQDMIIFARFIVIFRVHFIYLQQDVCKNHEL